MSATISSGVQLRQCSTLGLTKSVSLRLAGAIQETTGTSSILLARCGSHRQSVFLIPNKPTALPSLDCAPACRCTCCGEFARELFLNELVAAGRSVESTKPMANGFQPILEHPLKARSNDYQLAIAKLSQPQLRPMKRFTQVSHCGMFCRSLEDPSP